MTGVYGWIWRKLPGGLAGKLAGSVALLLGALALLFFVVFPYVEPRLPFNRVTVTGDPTGVPSPTDLTGVPSPTEGPPLPPLPTGSPTDR